MQKKIFSCYIIGDDSITIHCASVILKKNHLIFGLISQSKKIEEWCTKNTITYIKNIKDFHNYHQNRPFDFLFSIANGEILSSSILHSPRVCAINYHNSPLPKYAGLYATTWAIINSEKEHAISWHIMNKQVDMGDILKQTTFAIDENETALSLNLKCYENAIKIFSNLVEELASNTVTPIKQNLSCRSYYGLKNKPENYGIISWFNSSESIDCLCRALTFGSYKNELVTPKIFIEHDLLVVKSYRKLAVSSKKKPGTIVHCSTTGLHIATQTTDIVLYELMSLTGNVYPLEQLIKIYTLAVGKVLPTAKPQFLDLLTTHPAVNQPNIEKFWIGELLNRIPGGLSFLSPLNKMHKQPLIIQPKLKRVEISNQTHTRILHLSQRHNVPAKNIVAAIVVTYLYKMNNYTNFTVDYESTPCHEQVAVLTCLLESHVPLTTHFTRHLCFLDILLIIAAEHKRLALYKTYSKDIFIRYPELRGAACDSDVSLSYKDVSAPFSVLTQRKLNFYIAEDGSCLDIYNNTDYQSHEESYAFFNHMDVHLLTLLEDTLNHTNKKIFELSIIEAKEKRCLLHDWNNTQSDYDSNQLIHEVLKNRVALSPQSIAAIFKKEIINYEELNLKSSQIAHCLISHGVKSNDIVGIYMHRSIFMLNSILGVLKAGAAYLPLDPHYPNNRIKYMLNKSQSRILLTHNSLVLKHIDGYNGLILDVKEILSRQDSILPILNISIQSSDLAYVIYTSGTTGTPKGVAISHKALCNHMNWMKNAYDFSSQDVFLQKTPFSFDASVWEFFMPIWIGAPLVIAPDDAHASPTELISLILKYKVSILQLVPSMLREITLNPEFKSCASLRHVFCGGEILLPKTIQDFYEYQRSPCVLHNLYGPTEATIDAITINCTPSDATSLVSRIGKPIANTKVYILDDQKQLVPTGIIGELYLSGDGLAKGYLHDESLTQKNFLPNPFVNGELIYKTGDLGKWQSSGIVEFHGRCDSQLKIRGFRVEISEIESCLEKIYCIYQCLVKAHFLNNSESILVAYLVLLKNEAITATEIRGFLKQELPDYMMPIRFYVVDKLLTTPNGKLDRKNTLPFLYQLHSEKEYLTPQNNTEQILYDIWCSALKIEHLSINDDFFELGGHSLIAMNIVSRIKKYFSIELYMRTLFDNSTIYLLALKIEQLIRIKQSTQFKLTLSEQIIIPIKKSGTRTPLFLIHPIGGSIFWYKSLKPYLNKEVPLYGLQDPGLENHEFFFNSIEQMAATYIKAIQTIQPHGPYIIGGASFGSTVAIEIAKQFQTINESIKAIISLDGWAEYPALQKNKKHFKELMRKQNTRILQQYQNYGLTNSDTLLELQWHREEMLINYKLPRIYSKLILFKAEKLTELFNYDAPLNWWDNYMSGEIICHLVPGTHETMFSEPHLSILSKKLNTSLSAINNVLYDNLVY